MNLQKILIIINNKSDKMNDGEVMKVIMQNDENDGCEINDDNDCKMMTK